MYLVHITIIPIPLVLYSNALFQIQFLMQLYLLPFIQPDSDSGHNQEPITASVCSHSDSYQLIVTLLSNYRNYILAINRLDQKES